jgi:hypothetical protein
MLIANLETTDHLSVIHQLFSQSMAAVLLPIGYFPPISYFAYLMRNQVSIEKKEYFVRQSFRSRCTILGANGPLQLVVPREKSPVRLTIDKTVIHAETDWKTLHWRSLEAAYRSSPYFEYYEDDIKPFFQANQTQHFQTGYDSVKLILNLFGLNFEPKITLKYQTEFDGLDLRNAWNKQDYLKRNPVKEFPKYIQVFSDRHPFAPDLSILDLLFCEGPRSTDYLSGLELTLS